MYDGSTQQVFVPQPIGHLDKAAHETWDVAPEYGHVAPHDEHIVNLKLVHLRHICKRNRGCLCSYMKNVQCYKPEI
jgi:hypothetical protein